jgi:translation initiation factor IF-1
MPDEREGLEVSGRVMEQLPNALFRVQLENEARSLVTAHLSGSASPLTRIRVGDAVVVALSAYDAGRGRIVRMKS